jgi:hypothetical protein
MERTLLVQKYANKKQCRKNVSDKVANRVTTQNEWSAMTILNC